MERETIVAPITAPGVGAVSVVRISGPETQQIARQLCARGQEVVAAPRMMLTTDIGADGETIDCGMAVFFRAPQTFTGEDVLELHLHGSPYIVNKVIEAAAGCGARLAQPGEFSKRAFLNGKLDLTQAEAIADLIAAESAAQARLAREQLGGALSGAVAGIGEPLRAAAAEIEAYIDFPDEDIEPQTAGEWREQIGRVRAQIARYLETFRAGRICREGAAVCLAGFPNVGKSSLLNILLGHERAIVTDIAGTTRDHIEERISIGGMLIRLWDTAGLFDQEVSSRRAHDPDPVERLGIARSWAQLEQAELVLFVVDPADALDESLELRRRIGEKNANLLTIVNKADLLPAGKRPELHECLGGCIFVSAKSGEGLSELREEIRSRLAGSLREGVLVGNERHAERLSAALQALERATAAIEQLQPPELAALELRCALGALNDIVGVTETEDILGRIFSKFCIGK